MFPVAFREVFRQQISRFIINIWHVLESCKECGFVGSEDSFCGRFKNYCSLKCVRLFRLKQQGQSSISDTVAAVSSVQVCIYRDWYWVGVHSVLWDQGVLFQVVCRLHWGVVWHEEVRLPFSINLSWVRVELRTKNYRLSHQVKFLIIYRLMK